MQEHPAILLYDSEPTSYEARNLLQLFLVHKVRTVLFRDGEVSAEKAPGQVVINKSDTLSDTLKALMRLVLGYTGVFEYNAMEFLKENLVDVYCELLRRQLHASVTNAPPAPISTIDDSSTGVREVCNTVRFDVVSNDLRISFALRGPFENMKLLIERAMRRQNESGEMSDLIRGWSTAMEGVADHLKRVLNMYGISWEASQVTTRMYIDRLQDDYHWYISRELTIDHVPGYFVIFGVSLQATEEAAPAKV